MQERPLGVVVVAILVFGLGALPASVAAMRARADLRATGARAHARFRAAQPDVQREKFEERRIERRAAQPTPCSCAPCAPGQRCAPCDCPPAR